MWLSGRRLLSSSVVSPRTTAHSIGADSRLLWDRPPKNVLIVRKDHVDASDSVFPVASYLRDELGCTTFVEPSSGRSTQRDVPVDLVCSLGGDGTTIHVSSLFPDGPTPPILSFSLGTMGFLMPFSFAQHRQVLRDVMDGSCFVIERSRMHCAVHRADTGKERDFTIMNEAAIHRGATLHPILVECFLGDHLLTTSKADGLMISTPTGSTAYSLSAGGSIVNPWARCLILTPICPQSLSFRPLVLPTDVEVCLRVPLEARFHPIVSLDSITRTFLAHGDCVRLRSGEDCPLLTITGKDPMAVWVEDLNSQLKFNNPFSDRRGRIM